MDFFQRVLADCFRKELVRQSYVSWNVTRCCSSFPEKIHFSCKDSRTWITIKNIVRFHMLAEIIGFSIPMNVFHRDSLVFLQIWRWSPLHVSQMWYDGRRCVAFQEPPQWCTIPARCSGSSGSTKSAWNLGGNFQGPICYHTSLKIDTELFSCVLNYLGITSSWNNFYFCWTCYLQSNEWRLSFVWT